MLLICLGKFSISSVFTQGTVQWLPLFLPQSRASCQYYTSMRPKQHLQKYSPSFLAKWAVSKEFLFPSFTHWMNKAPSSFAWLQEVHYYVLFGLLLNKTEVVVRTWNRHNRATVMQAEDQATWHAQCWGSMRIVNASEMESFSGLCTLSTSENKWLNSYEWKSCEKQVKGQPTSTTWGFRQILGPVKWNHLLEEIPLCIV